jgi:hypothetical protein
MHDNGAKSIWEILLERKSIDSSIIAHNVIKCFPQKNDNFSPVAAGRNRWVTYFPFPKQ